MNRTHGWVRYLGVALWAAGFAVFWIRIRSWEGGIGALLEGWLLAVTISPLSGLWLFVIYLVRPVLFLPTTILTVCSGYLFGPVWGFAYSFSATLISASVAYFFPRLLSIPIVPPSAGFFQRLREAAFEAVLCARLVAIPGDFVNYASGILRVPFTAFFVATAIGGLPSLLAAVLAGASIEGDFRFGGLRLNIWYVLISLFLLVGNLVVAREIRRRQRIGLGKGCAKQKKSAQAERV